MFSAQPAHFLKIDLLQGAVRPMEKDKRDWVGAMQQMSRTDPV